MTDTLTGVYNTLVAVVAAVAPDLATGPESAISAILQAMASEHADVLASLTNAQNAAYSSTATGSALDQLAADAGLLRNPAVAASGSVTFTGLPNGPAGGWSVPTGTVVATPANASNPPVFFTLQAAVTVPSGGTASGTVTCQAAGSVGNVVAGSISQFTQVQGIASVTNAAAFSNGADAEADTALRARIQASRTVLYSAAAVQAAALAVSGCAFASLSDPKNGSGSTTCYIAASDGSLSGSLQSAVQTAVNAVLPLTETCTISAFGLVHPVIQATIAVLSGYSQNVVQANVVSAIAAYLLTLGAGATLQPFPLSNYLDQNVAGLADFYLTSSIPTVGGTQLLRLLAAPGASTLGTASTGGALSNGTFYVQVTWTTASGETLPSTEQTITLSGGTSTQTITVTPPAFPDSVVTGANVYIAAASGQEKKQGSVSGSGATYTQSAALSTTNPAPPATNTLSAATVTVGTL